MREFRFFTGYRYPGSSRVPLHNYPLLRCCLSLRARVGPCQAVISGSGIPSLSPSTGGPHGSPYSSSSLSTWLALLTAGQVVGGVLRPNGSSKRTLAVQGPASVVLRAASKQALSLRNRVIGLRIDIEPAHRAGHLFLGFPRDLGPIS